MFDITYEDDALFQQYIPLFDAQDRDGSVTYLHAKPDVPQQCVLHPVCYRGSQYVFTFDHRFLCYYYKRCDKYVYVAIDHTTGLGSEFAATTIKYKKNEFDTLIPQILNAIKYTGELKYLSAPQNFVTKND